MHCITNEVIIEILTNPYDLAVSIYQDKENDKYGAIISRGPKCDYKNLLSSKAFADNPKEIISTVKDFFTSIEILCRYDSLNEESFLYSLICEGDEDFNQSKLLSEEMVQSIVKELTIKGNVSTHNFLIKN